MINLSEAMAKVYYESGSHDTIAKVNKIIEDMINSYSWKNGHNGEGYPVYDHATLYSLINRIKASNLDK